MEVRQGVELPKKQHPGRPKGTGSNFLVFKRLRKGDTVWDVPAKKMRSLIVSAQYYGIKLMVRRIPNSKRYAFKIIHDEPTEVTGGPCENRTDQA